MILNALIYFYPDVKDCQKIMIAIFLNSHSDLQRRQKVQVQPWVALTCTNSLKHFYRNMKIFKHFTKRFKSTVAVQKFKLLQFQVLY